MRKNSILFTILLMSLVSFAQNDSAAKKLLDKVSGIMSSYNNVFIKFDYSLVNKAAGVEQNNKGDLTLKGEKYKVDFFGTTQVYDGSKTYTIIPENEEINISTTTDNDENTLTPSKFYSFYKNGYTYKMGEKKHFKGKDIQYVTLTPTDSGSEIKNVLIGINTKTNHIYKIIENGKNDTKTVLTIKKFVVNRKLDPSVFTVDLKKYEGKGYIIND